MDEEVLARLTASVDRGDRAAASALAGAALAAGIEPLTILHDGLMPGMRAVGEKFASGEYFLPEMMVAAAAMKSAMAILEPALRARQEGAGGGGRVVIGTVRGDIHEIGKSLVATMLSANGFDVTDLGVDVPVDRFVQAVDGTRADIVGLSALLTTTMGAQRSVIEALAAAGLRARVKVIVGGAPVTQRWADEIGADGYARDAVAAVSLARGLRRMR